MSKSKVLPGLLFKILFGFLGSYLGAHVGGFAAAGQDVYTAPIIFLACIFAGLLIGVGLAIYLNRKLSRGQFNRVFLLVVAAALLVITWIVYSHLTQRLERTSIRKSASVRTVAAAAIATPNAEPLVQTDANHPLGVGIIKPHLMAGQSLYFYGSPDFDKLADPITAQDSVTFVAGPHYIDIGYAPPWFWPEALKLDYNILFLRAVTLSRNWVEVIVNRETGLTRWVDRHAVGLQDWTTFLLNVPALEVLDPASNPVRVKPLDYAGVSIENFGEQLRPIAIKGSWIKVVPTEPPDRNTPTGWVRWRKDDQLIIAFSILL